MIDYAKIANIIEVRSDLAKLIVNYLYPVKQKFTKLAVIPTTTPEKNSYSIRILLF